MKQLIVVVLFLMFGCVAEKAPETKTYVASNEDGKLSVKKISGYESLIGYYVIDLRVPGNWKFAGDFFVKTYPHAKEEVLDTLFANLLPDSLIHGQMRNEPILWVLAMLDNTYGLKSMINQERYEALEALRQSKEYAENKSYAAHVEQLLTNL